MGERDFGAAAPPRCRGERDGGSSDVCCSSHTRTHDARTHTRTHTRRTRTHTHTHSRVRIQHRAVAERALRVGGRRPLFFFCDKHITNVKYYHSDIYIIIIIIIIIIILIIIIITIEKQLKTEKGGAGGGARWRRPCRCRLPFAHLRGVGFAGTVASQLVLATQLLMCGPEKLQKRLRLREFKLSYVSSRRSRAVGICYTWGGGGGGLRRFAV